MNERDNARYIYCSSQANADAMQAAFIALSYADNAPEKWFAEFHKEGEAAVRIAMKTDERFWIREDAPMDGFDALLQPYIDQGLMPQEDLDTVHDRIRIFRGTGVGLYLFNMLPKIIRDYSWTYQEMVDNGWITDEE